MKNPGIDKAFNIFAGAVVAVIVATVSFNQGVSRGKSEIVDSAIVKLRRESDDYLKSQDVKIAANRVKIDRLEKYDSLLDDLKKKVRVQSDVHDNLTSSIRGKQSELDSLTSKVQTAKSAPVNLPAGRFTVGSDIRSGRYTVYGSSNFVVRDATGDIKVNTILGDSTLGVDQYVCDLEDGDRIEAESRVRLYPMG